MLITICIDILWQGGGWTGSSAPPPVVRHVAFPKPSTQRASILF